MEGGEKLRKTRFCSAGFALRTRLGVRISAFLARSKKPAKRQSFSFLAGLEGKTSHNSISKFTRNEAFVREVEQEIKRWEKELGGLYQEKILQKNYT